ncbi:hypothetical protein WME94_56955 [Sorangium sp. So ce429]
MVWICTEAAARRPSNLDAHIRRRLRALLLKQWKRKRTIARRLIRLGVKPKTARKVHEGHRSWWALSHYSPVDRGLRNAYFAERGLVSLAAKWSELSFRLGVRVRVRVRVHLPRAPSNATHGCLFTRTERRGTQGVSLGRAMSYRSCVGACSP